MSLPKLENPNRDDPENPSRSTSRHLGITPVPAFKNVRPHVVRPDDGNVRRPRNVIQFPVSSAPHGPRHLLGEISLIRMKALEHHDGPVEVFNVLVLGLIAASGVGFLLLGEALCGWSMVAAEAHTPREKILRPFFS